jgi:hypothetical protein
MSFLLSPEQYHAGRTENWKLILVATLWYMLAREGIRRVAKVVGTYIWYTAYRWRTVVLLAKIFIVRW